MDVLLIGGDSRCEERGDRCDDVGGRGGGGGTPEGTASPPRGDSRCGPLLSAPLESGNDIVGKVGELEVDEEVGEVLFGGCCSRSRGSPRCPNFC